jgi:hypothetical protein
MKLYRKTLFRRRSHVFYTSGCWIDYGFFNGKPQPATGRCRAQSRSFGREPSGSGYAPARTGGLSGSEGEVVTYNDFHFSPLSRILQTQMRNVFYNPILYSECERYYSDRFSDPVNVGTPRRNASIVQTCPMDEHGYFNFGLHNSSTYTSLTHTDVVVVETNSNLPFCPAA